MSRAVAGKEAKYHRHSHTISIASLAFVVLVLTSVVCWHGEKTQQLAQAKEVPLVSRFLNEVDEDNKDAPAIDDDQKRSETCKKYLYNFLNDTTDGNDQCQGFYTAYKDADCAHSTHTILAASTLKGDDKKKNTTDDDILLPPIIFQAALSIDKRAFRRDLFPILAFAGLGTAFCAVAIGLVCHHVSKLGPDDSLPLLDSLVFGSLISSVDPVATLSILSGVGVSQTDTLYTLIFGESLLNDGVAIVLFDTLKSHLGEIEELGPDAYRDMATHFFAVLFGTIHWHPIDVRFVTRSIGIGLGAGICCTLYFWTLRGRQTAVTEVAVFFCWALIPYYVADGAECSGIIAIMVMGFFMDYFVIGGFQSEDAAWMDYMSLQNQGANPTGTQEQSDRWAHFQKSCSKAFSGRGHILSRSRTHVGFVAQVVASIMETAIFAYLGLFLFTDNKWDFRLNMTGILGVVSSRGVMVGILSLLINIFVFFDVEGRLIRCVRSFRQVNLAEDDESLGSHARAYLDKRTQLILLLAGVRGAVSFSLVENVPVWDAVSKTGSKYKAELKAMTSSSIVFTLFVFGALTYITVKRGSDAGEEGHIAGSRLTHRLISEPLDSDDENQSEVISSANALEIDHNIPQQEANFENDPAYYPPRPEWMN
eukprot:scaffold6350_cov117-Cylindrotheca_fusiformis.AAC.2